MQTWREQLAAILGLTAATFSFFAVAGAVSDLTSFSHAHIGWLVLGFLFFVGGMLLFLKAGRVLINGYWVLGLSFVYAANVLGLTVSMMRVWAPPTAVYIGIGVSLLILTLVVAAAGFVVMYRGLHLADAAQKRGS